MEGESETISNVNVSVKNASIQTQQVCPFHRPRTPRTGKRIRNHETYTAQGIKRKKANLDQSSGKSEKVNKENKYESAEKANEMSGKVAKTTSSFAQLRSSLSSVNEIVKYIRQSYKSNKFTSAKTLNTFLQAISNRPSCIYEELIPCYPREVLYILEKLFSYVSANTKMFTPPAHEFVIRCEQNGLRKADLSTTKTTKTNSAADKNNNGIHDDNNSDGNNNDDSEIIIETLIYSPRELMKKLAALDPRGRWMRKVELCTSLDDIHRCASKISSLFASRFTNVNDYAEKCQLVSKLISKARRVMLLSCLTSVNKLENAENDLSVPSHNSKEITTNETNEYDEQKENKLQSVKQSLLQPTREIRKECKEVNSELAELMCTVLSTRPANSTQQPVTKCIHYVKWCREYKLIRESDFEKILAFEEDANKDLEKQALQLETVMKLKSVPSCSITTVDEKESVTKNNDNNNNNICRNTLLEILKSLWEAGGETHYEPCSADVLSSIATAVINAIEKGYGDNKLKEEVASCLVQTQLYINKRQEQSSPSSSSSSQQTQLPRRALRLVQSVRDARKHAALAARLAEEDKK